MGSNFMLFDFPDLSYFLKILSLFFFLCGHLASPAAKMSCLATCELIRIYHVYY